jgi:hypothetical protein
MGPRLRGDDAEFALLPPHTRPYMPFRITSGPAHGGFISRRFRARMLAETLRSFIRLQK